MGRFSNLIKRYWLVALLVAGIFVMGAWRASGMRGPADPANNGSSGAAAAAMGEGSDEVPASDAVQATHEASVDPQAVVGASDRAASVDPSARSEASGGTSESSPQRFTMPEGAEYEPDIALMSVAEGATVEEVNALLEHCDAVATKKVTEEDLAQGVLTVEVSRGSTVEDAVNELLGEGPVEEAQPDYIYYMLAGDEGDLRARLAENIVTTSDEDVPATPEDVRAQGEASAEADSADSGSNGASTAEDAADDTAQTPQTNADEPEPESNEAASTKESLDAAQDSANLAEAFKINDPYAQPDATQQWGLTSMRAYEAWSVARCEGNVSVAVLDNKPKITHPDLADNIKVTYDAYAGEATYSGAVNHGTHVAGIVGATANNGIGVAGVSYNAGIVAVNVFSSSLTSSTSKLLKAYDFVTSTAQTYNTHVINVSVGGKKSADKYSSNDKLLIQAIADAYENYGIATVAASGNAATNATVPYDEIPGDFANVVSVINLARGTTEGTVKRYYTSNYNVAGQRRKNISAPGTSIYSTGADRDYYTETGTSMASPAVAGVLALEWAANPNLTVKEAVSVLYASAKDLGAEGWDEEYGYGEVDAYAAVTAAKDPEQVQRAVELVEATTEPDTPEPAMPTAVGATRIPVGASAEYTVKDGTIALKAGEECATLEGNVLAGVKAGTVTLALLDTTGAERATMDVEVYATDGTWAIKTAIDEDADLVLDVENGNLDNKANVRLYTANGTRAQSWVVVQQGDGTVVVRSARTGKALDVAGGSLESGANVQQYGCNQTKAQSWTMIVDENNLVSFINAGSGKALDVSGGKAEKLRNVQQYASNGTRAQKWVLAKTDVEMGAVWEGVYRLSSALDSTYVLDVAGGSVANGANVRLYRTNGTAAQKWKLEYVGDGAYRITCLKSGRVLDVAGGSVSKSANVQQWGWNGTQAQRWKVSESPLGGYVLTNAKSGLVLDVLGGKVANGQNVQQYPSNGTTAQRWLLTQY